MSVAAEQKANKRVISVNGVDQIFWYDDADDLADQLTKAQENATKKIAEQAEELRILRKNKVITTPAAEPSPSTPAQGSGTFKAKELSADDRHRIAMNLQNPDTSADAIREAIELGLGGNIQEIRAALNAAGELARQNKHREEGAKFRNAHPDFLLYDDETRMAIEKDIYDWMIAKKVPFTAEWIGKAYEDLGANELLPPRPADPDKKTTEQPGELPASGKEANSSTRPRAAFSTGVRRDTGTSATPKRENRDPGEVWAEIDAMTPEEFDRKMMSQSFRDMVNALPARG